MNGYNKSGPETPKTSTTASIEEQREVQGLLLSLCTDRKERARHMLASRFLNERMQKTKELIQRWFEKHPESDGTLCIAYLQQPDGSEQASTDRSEMSSSNGGFTPATRAFPRTLASENDDETSFFPQRHAEDDTYAGGNHEGDERTENYRGSVAGKAARQRNGNSFNDETRAGEPWNAQNINNDNNNNSNETYPLEQSSAGAQSVLQRMKVKQTQRVKKYKVTREEVLGWLRVDQPSLRREYDFRIQTREAQVASVKNEIKVTYPGMRSAGEKVAPVHSARMSAPFASECNSRGSDASLSVSKRSRN